MSLGPANRATRGGLLFLPAALVITSSVVRATPPTAPPIPPELQFAVDSLMPVMGNTSRARWVLEKLRPIEAEFPHNGLTLQIKFYALVASRAPVHEITAIADTLIAMFGSLPDSPDDHRSSQTQAHKCLDVAEALLERREALPVAEQYARRSVDFARVPRTWLYGHSMQVLADVQYARGMPDSATATIEQAIAGLREDEQQTLLKDLRYTLGLILDERGREDDAITALFASAAIDPNESPRAAEPLHRIWTKRFGSDANLDSRIHEARRIWRQWPGMSFGAYGPERAPEWSQRDRTGNLVHSSGFLGKPLVVVFWGSWSEANRAAARLASEWYRHRDSLGVQVVGVNRELPGPGALSVRIADTYARHERLAFPIVSDEDEVVFNAFKARAYPSMFLIDSDGLIRGAATGFLPQYADSLTARVRLLAVRR